MDATTLNTITAFNITDSDGKIAAIYVFTLLLGTFAPLFMLFKYRKKYYRWKNQTEKMAAEDEDHVLTDLDICNYAVRVTNLPNQYGVQDLSKSLTDALRRCYPSDPATGQETIVKVRIIGDYNELYRLSIKLKNVMEKHEYIRA